MNVGKQANLFSILSMNILIISGKGVGLNPEFVDLPNINSKKGTAYLVEEVGLIFNKTSAKAIGYYKPVI